MQVIGGITIDGGVTITRPPISQIFSTPGTYSWVAQSSSAIVTIVGAGGGGSGGYVKYNGGFSWDYGNGGGGQGGEVLIDQTVSLTPGATYTVTVGAGGATGINGYGYLAFNRLPTVGSTGETSKIELGASTIISAAGGYGGGQPSDDYQRGGSYFYGSRGPFYGGEKYISVFITTELAPAVPLDGYSGGGRGFNGPGDTYMNPGSGGVGGGYIDPNSPTEPVIGYSGYVKISW